MKGNYEKQREENSKMIKLYASKINCLDNQYASILVIFIFYMYFTFIKN